MKLSRQPMVPDERRAPTPLAQLEGRVDISALDAHVRVAIRRLQDGTSEISPPGLLIQVGEAAGACDVDDESMVVAVGSPLKEKAEALNQIKVAEELTKGNPVAHYNVGLLCFELPECVHEATSCPLEGVMPRTPISPGAFQRLAV